jgi:epidermal growth factor receptor substrate 15
MYGSAGGDPHLALYNRGSGTVSMLVIAHMDGASSVPLNTWQDHGCARDDTDKFLYFNGKLDASFAQSPDDKGNGQASFGNRHDGFDATDLDTALFIQWNRVLSSEEFKALHDNPWQIFQPRTQIIPSSVAAANTFGIIPKRVPWTGPPSTNIKLNVGHPLATGLSHWYPQAEEDAVWFDYGPARRGQLTLDAGTSARVTTSHGNYAIDFDNGLSEFTTLAVGDLPNSNTFTVAFWARGTVYENSHIAVSLYNSGGSSSNLLAIYPFAQSGGDGVQVFWNGNNRIDQDTGAVSLNELHFYVFTSRSATDHEMYVDAVSVGSSSTSLSLVSNTDRIGLGHWNGGQNFDRGIMKDVSIHARGMNSEEVSDWYFNQRWALYAPRTQLIPVGAIAAAGEANISALPSAVLTLTANVPTVVSTEDNTSQLGTATLTLTANVPQAVTTENHISSVASATLTLTGNVPQTITTEGHISQLGTAVLTLTGNVPQAITTQGEVSLLPSATLTLTENVPQAVTTEKHISALTSAVLTLTANVPQAVTTEKNISSLGTAVLTLTGNVPQAVTTQGEISLLPSATITLTANVPQGVTSEKHISLLASATLSLVANVPQVVTTENRVSLVPSAVLTLTGNVPQAITTAGETSLLPSATLTLTGNVPQAVTTEKHISLVPLAVLTLTANVPQAISTEKHVSLLGTATLTLTANVPLAITFDPDTSTLPSATLTLTANIPTVVSTDSNITTLPGAVITLTANVPTVFVPGNVLDSTDDPNVIDVADPRFFILVS